MTRLHRIWLLAVMVVVLFTCPVLAEDAVKATLDRNAVIFTNPLPGQPEYLWWYGCSPTSGGMLMGYWAGKGYSKLLPGVADPMVQDAKVNQAIASPEHINADPVNHPLGTYKGHPPNSIADFMKTEDGGSSADNISLGLVQWSNYVGQGANSHHDWVSYWGGTFTYADFKAEIDAGRPMLLNLYTYAPSPYNDWVGHSVVGYGYRDSMFSLINPLDSSIIRVPGFAVMDTWKNGVGPGTGADWYGPGYSVVYAIQDAQGREWWPFLDMTLTGGWDWVALWDWQVVDGCFYQPVQPVPVPAALWLLGSGLLGLAAWRRWS